MKLLLINKQYEIITQFGLLKMRANIECLDLAFNEFTFYGHFKGKRSEHQGCLILDLVVWHSYRAGNYHNLLRTLHVLH